MYKTDYIFFLSTVDLDVADVQRKNSLLSLDTNCDETLNSNAKKFVHLRTLTGTTLL